MLILGTITITIIAKKEDPKGLNKLIWELMLFILVTCIYWNINLNVHLVLFNNNVQIDHKILEIIMLGLFGVLLSNLDNKYVNFLLIGSLLIQFSDNKILLIIGLEIQSFSIYILISKSNPKSLGSLNYYILGSLSSVLILLGILYNDKFFLLGIIFKLSIFPTFKFWVELYDKISWKELVLIINVPKISLLLLISVNGGWFENKELWLLISLLTQLVGSLGGLYTVSIRKIISYSSINQVGLIVIILLLLDDDILKMYLIQYIITTILLLSLFSWNSINNLNKENSYKKIIIFVLLLSLISIPVSLGFYGKWYVLEALSSNNEWKWIILVVLTSILIGYIYLRILNNLINTNPNINTIETINNHNITLSSIAMLIVMLSMLDPRVVIHIVANILSC